MDSRTNEIRCLLARLPSAVHELVSTTWTRFAERLNAEHLECPEDPEFLDNLCKVWVASRFAAEFCIRNPSTLLDLQNSGYLSASKLATGYRFDLQRLEFNTEDELMRGLRIYRNREMIRIAWRDIGGRADLNETLNDLSLLAESCLQFAHDWLYSQACVRYGTPALKNGRSQRLVVLGMGKLGARELNFSSDIDLIFAFEEEGLLLGKKEKSHGEFFNGLCRSLVRVIDTVTADGFVFRVDLRLRPFGASGPLVMSFSAMESYYQRQAREWERYAFIKVRPVAGDLDAGTRLEMMLKPFVYRRYLDYGSFAELRKLKARITQELQRKDRLENIKLGPGGIREIEFIAQVFQLIRGGHDPALQERGILKVLGVLGEKSLLPHSVIEQLQTSYVFLRTVENRLQEYADRQVHDLPEQELDRQRIAHALGFQDWNRAKARIDRVRAQVQDLFEQVFGSPQSEFGHGDAGLIWAGTGNLDQSRQMLGRIGYPESSQALSIIDGFKTAPAIRKLSAAGASELDRLMPLLLGAAGQNSNPDDVLKKILGLIESIASRKVYLSLLIENPLALSQLVKLAAASSWIVAFIGRHPILLDELLDPRALYGPLSRQALAKEIDQRLVVIGGDDLERQMAQLRELKQAQVLRVAVADIAGAIGVSTVSDYLTDLAQVVLDKVMHLAWRLVAEKHGAPPGADQDKLSGFAIIGYGKLGGRELGYGSDLDLVFLYAGVPSETRTNGSRPISSVQFYVRVGQRMINLLDTKMLAGVLYEVDMRLRPSGNSGFLVSQINAFEQYQLNRAWTFEHQALVRARFVAGDVSLGLRFSGIRTKVLARHRDLPVLKKDIREMRAKMRDNLATRKSGLFDLKQGSGGIADIEFIVQFGVLLHAHEYPKLLQFSDTVGLLDRLPETGFLSSQAAEFLKNAYYEYRNLGHRAALQGRPAFIPDNTLIEIRTQVEQIWLASMS